MSCICPFFQEIVLTDHDYGSIGNEKWDNYRQISNDWIASDCYKFHHSEEHEEGIYFPIVITFAICILIASWVVFVHKQVQVIRFRGPYSIISASVAGSLSALLIVIMLDGDITAPTSLQLIVHIVLLPVQWYAVVARGATVIFGYEWNHAKSIMPLMKDPGKTLMWFYRRKWILSQRAFLIGLFLVLSVGSFTAMLLSVGRSEGTDPALRNSFRLVHESIRCKWVQVSDLSQQYNISSIVDLNTDQAVCSCADLILVGYDDNNASEASQSRMTNCLSYIDEICLSTSNNADSFCNACPAVMLEMAKSDYGNQFDRNADAVNIYDKLFNNDSLVLKNEVNNLKTCCYTSLADHAARGGCVSEPVDLPVFKTCLTGLYADEAGTGIFIFFIVFWLVADAIVVIWLSRTNDETRLGKEVRLVSIISSPLTIIGISLLLSEKGARVMTATHSEFNDVCYDGERHKLGFSLGEVFLLMATIWMVTIPLINPLILIKTRHENLTWIEFFGGTKTQVDWISEKRRSFKSWALLNVIHPLLSHPCMSSLKSSTFCNSLLHTTPDTTQGSMQEHTTDTESISTNMDVEFIASPSFQFKRRISSNKFDVKDMTVQVTELDICLAFPTAREIYRKFAVSEFSSDQLAFLCDVIKITERSQEITLEELGYEALRVYQMYIQPDSPLEVNLSQAMRLAIVDHFRQSREPQSHESAQPPNQSSSIALSMQDPPLVTGIDDLLFWFSPAIIEIRRLILLDSWYRFSKSDDYLKVVMFFESDKYLGRVNAVDDEDHITDVIEAESKPKMSFIDMVSQFTTFRLEPSSEKKIKTILKTDVTKLTLISKVVGVREKVKKKEYSEVAENSVECHMNVPSSKIASPFSKNSLNDDD